MDADIERKFLHALLLASQGDIAAVQKIFLHFGSYAAAWQAGAGELELAGIENERCLEMKERQYSLNTDDAFGKLAGEGIALLLPRDDDFPKSLLTIASPPQWLYIKGRVPQDRPHLAVVGTRKATTYGREAARKIISELARAADVAIVSGLAQGIDTEAHCASLEANLATIGILGSGLDPVSFFPAQNWNLAEEIVQKDGAVISEYPPGTPALKHHFIERNRLIAGLALGTVVIEAPEKSGALITAGFALEQGREVFAVPGPIFSLQSAGVHRLIQAGAKLVSSAQDIIEELNILKRAPTDTNISPDLTDETEKRIFALLDEARSVDELKQATQLETTAILTGLSSLELKGVVRPMGQNRFQRIA